MAGRFRLFCAPAMVLLAGLLLFVHPVHATTSRVAIQPLGHVDPALTHAVAERIHEVFDADVEILDPAPLPASAYYAPRNRYRGERLVAWLESRRPARATKILGLMSRDLSATKGRVHDWGIMGVAGLGETSGVVSVYRLGRRGAPAAAVERRARQVAIHELGHTFGLPHCRTPRCIMNDAEGGIGAVDRSSGHFCPACRARLGEWLRGAEAGSRSPTQGGA
jgi:archaemetzincin